MISYFQESTSYEPVAGGVVPEHESTYTQNYSFDILGNMTTKTSVQLMSVLTEGLQIYRCR